MSYPAADNPSRSSAAPAEQPADTLPWPVWRIVNSPRWSRSASGPDYLIFRGWLVVIVPGVGGMGYAYSLDGVRSAERFDTEMEARVAAARVVLAAPHSRSDSPSTPSAQFGRKRIA